MTTAIGKLVNLDFLLLHAKRLKTRSTRACFFLANFLLVHFFFYGNRGKLDLPPGLPHDWLHILYMLIKQEYPQIERDKRPVFVFLSGDEVHNLAGMELLKTLEVVGHQDFGFFRGTLDQWVKAVSFAHHDDKAATTVTPQTASGQQEVGNDIPDDHQALVGAGADVPDQTEEEIFAELSQGGVYLPPRASAVRARQLSTTWSERLNEEAEDSDQLNSSSSSSESVLFQRQKKKKQLKKQKAKRWKKSLKKV